MNLTTDGQEPRRTRHQRTRWATQDKAWDDIQTALSGLRATVYDAIREEPATCDELEQRLGLTHQTCSATVNHLMNSGLIVACDSRKTRSGRSARVWTVRQAETLFPMGAA